MTRNRYGNVTRLQKLNSSKYDNHCNEDDVLNQESLNYRRCFDREHDVPNNEMENLIVS